MSTVLQTAACSKFDNLLILNTNIGGKGKNIYLKFVLTQYTYQQHSYKVTIYTMIYTLMRTSSNIIYVNLVLWP